VRRVYEITVEGGARLTDRTGKDITGPGMGEQPFEFFGDNIGEAQDHADQLDSDPNFGRVTSPPRFVRWAEDGSL